MKTQAAPSTAREKLLAAADRLFYEEGIHTVGIDRVIEEAGVAKASLYSAFGSKDELVKAYLEARFERRKKRIDERLAEHETGRDRILALFDVIAQLAREGGFRGCAFLRATAEGPRVTGVAAVCDDYRAWLNDLFVKLARETGARQPSSLASQLLLLYDGTAVASQMESPSRAAATASSARKAASALIDAATA